jgi:hypothetical protein
LLGELLFEVAVYRLSLDEWGRLLDTVDADAASSHLRRLQEGPVTDDDLIRQTLLHRVSRGLDFEYPYNQVIAWIRLLWDGPGPVIKGYAYRIPQPRFTQRFRSTNAPPFEYWDKVIECWFQEDATSEQIAGEVRQDLIALTTKDEVFARRHVDLEAFDTLSPRLDWRGLIGLD